MGEATEEVVDVKNGGVIERRLAPNEKVLQYLVNRLAGKPVSVKEINMDVQQTTRSLIISMGPAPGAQQQQEQGQPAVSQGAAPVPALPPGPQGSGFLGHGAGTGDKVIDIAARRRAA